MSELKLWIYRLITIICCTIVVFFCEKYNIKPCGCVFITTLTILVLTIFVGIIDYFWRNNEQF